MDDQLATGVGALTVSVELVSNNTRCVPHGNMVGAWRGAGLLFGLCPRCPDLAPLFGWVAGGGARQAPRHGAELQLTVLLARRASCRQGSQREPAKSGGGGGGEPRRSGHGTGGQDRRPG